jgi:hypothetical protein
MSREEPGNPPIKAFEGRPFDRLRTLQDRPATVRRRNVGE